MTSAHDLTRNDFRFFDRLRVRWAEVDVQKIVFNAHYLMYFDTAFSAYWRANALPYDDTMHELQGDLYVRRATVDFKASARFDDLLDLGIKCSRIGTSSITFVGGLFRQQQLLVTFEVVYVFANPVTQTPRAVPTVLRELLLGYEDGDSVTRQLKGSVDELGADFAFLRSIVLSEQDDAVTDNEDPSGTILVAVRNRIGVPLATGRLLTSQSGLSCIDQLVVHKMMRGEGLGGEVLDALERLALQRGDSIVSVLADEAAKSFYTKRDYVLMEEVLVGGAVLTRLERILR